MRRWLALILHLFAVLGALLCIADLLLIRDTYERNAATGDFAGAGLGLAFLVTTFLPLTLIAFISALWLHPPRWLARITGNAGAGQGEGGEPRHAARGARAIVAPGLALAAAAVLATAVAMLASGLRSGYEYYGLRGAGLFKLALQDLIWFLPMILLSGVLVWLAVARARPGRRLER